MRLLLHACCAPCANRPIESLRQEGMAVTGFWFNPNIHPYTEYQARKSTLEAYAKEIGMKLIIGGILRLRFRDCSVSFQRLDHFLIGLNAHDHQITVSILGNEQRLTAGMANL